MGKNLYNDQSIESLSPREFTRLRPGVYCGSTEYSTQLLIEIVSNAIDEFQAGNGDTINVNYEDDGSCKVEDFAQGFPVNVMREDGETVLQASFDVLNTSGKFSDDGVYEGTALGLNGIGSKLTNFLSSRLVVNTYRNGQAERVAFKDGIFCKRDVGKQGFAHTGTIVEWTPDPQFFNHPQIEVDRIKKIFHVLTCLCKGLTINLTHNGEDLIVYHSDNGLNDLVNDIAKDNEIINNRLNINFAEGKNKLDFVLTYTTNYSLNMISYVNTGETDSGPHITQIKSTITREFNKFFKEKGWLKDKDKTLEGGDIQEGMLIAFNITAPGVSYDAQTKSRIVKLDMTPFTGVLSENIQNWLAINEKDIKIIFDKAVSARKARETAKKARDAAREIKPKTKKEQLLNMPTKLVDCWGKDRMQCELLISEGDSAASGLVEARDSEIHAVFPIRGKIIAAYKNSTEKIFANQEVVNLIKAIGLDLNPTTHKLIYNTKKLRYGKILLCADADPDGASIRNLLIEMFWWLCPELILNGHVYTTMPPLFRITTKKNEYIYLKDAGALEQYKLQHQGEKFQINRNKGLGEQDSAELHEALLDPATRNIAKLVVEDEQKTAILIETLLGPSVPPRRAFLLEHAEEANDID
jgi:DNA gyrase/topoisomerase IV subunit B